MKARECLLVGFLALAALPAWADLPGPVSAVLEDTRRILDPVIALDGVPAIHDVRDYVPEWWTTRRNVNEGQARLRGIGVVDEARIFSRFPKKRIVVLADLHTNDFVHAQVVRVIDEVARTSPGRPLFIAEFISPTVQGRLDQFISGQINPTVEELAKILRHEEFFFGSFKFETFYPILAALRKHRITTVAAMAPSPSTHWSDNRARDGYTRALVLQALQDPTRQVILMQGFGHLLGRGSLCDRLGLDRDPRAITLLTAIPPLYFEALKAGLPAHAGGYLVVANSNHETYYYLSQAVGSSRELGELANLNRFLIGVFPEPGFEKRLTAGTETLRAQFDALMAVLAGEQPQPAAAQGAFTAFKGTLCAYLGFIARTPELRRNSNFATQVAPALGRIYQDAGCAAHP